MTLDWNITPKPLILRFQVSTPTAAYRQLSHHHPIVYAHTSLYGVCSLTIDMALWFAED